MTPSNSDCNQTNILITNAGVIPKYLAVGYTQSQQATRL